jgi:hypothetical protein
VRQRFPQTIGLDPGCRIAALAPLHGLLGRNQFILVREHPHQLGALRIGLAIPVQDRKGPLHQIQARERLGPGLVESSQDTGGGDSIAPPGRVP